MQPVIINERVLWQFQLALDPEKKIADIEQLAKDVAKTLALCGKPDKNHRAMRRWGYIVINGKAGSANVTYKGKRGSDEPLIVTYFSFRGAQKRGNKRGPVVERKNPQPARQRA